MMAQIDTYKALGAPCYVYAETTGTVQNKMDAPLTSRPRLREFRAPRLWAEADRARRVDGATTACRMTYHHHMGTIVETEREIDLLMRYTGKAVGLLLDTGHLHLRRRRRGGHHASVMAAASTTSTARTCGGTC